MERLIERLYRRYADDCIFRNTIISFFMELCQRVPELKEKLPAAIESANIDAEVKELILEDIEEAIENLALRESMVKHPKLRKVITRFTQALTHVPKEHNFS